MTQIAILIPCYNEAITIGKVVTDFRREIPEAEIHVFDNNSNDNTSEVAAAAGASFFATFARSPLSAFMCLQTRSWGCFFMNFHAGQEQ